ncbi:hypothetical protein [Rhodopirellula sallentina]|uniref:Membrane protein n=1 Tax=Rhodopirellula sallentina SM41 TaxID=1263870 RepID=M5U2Z4_9BACT|nr:hypothetical protein [Rhodopirellula sallentina]EMI52211.1 membrane protein [Rhodopirellula sallentina SM41]
MKTRGRHDWNRPPDKNPHPDAEGVFACVSLLIVCAIHRDSLIAMDPANWASVSAWFLLIVGIFIANRLGGRFESMLERLHKRNAIDASQDQFDRLLAQTRKRARTAATVGSLVLPMFLLASYIGVYAGEQWQATPRADRMWFIGEVILEVIAARLVGRYAGRGIAYGLFGRQLVKERIKLTLIPGHSDAAAGLRPIGDYYFYQATITALPVLFFAFWVLAMPNWTKIWPASDSDFESQWKNTYLIFFLVTIGIELLTFALPLWFFHQQMSLQKKQMQSRVDELSARLYRLQQSSRDSNQPPDDGADRASLIDQIASLENLPTWPLAPDVRQRFAWGNLAFLASPALQMSQTVLDAVKAAVT